MLKSNDKDHEPWKPEDKKIELRKKEGEQIEAVALITYTTMCKRAS